MEKEFCPHCGQSVSSHKHSLSENMVRMLHKAHSHRSSIFHLQHDLDLTKNEYANFQKLKYWGLVEKTDTSGYWRVTSHGRDFLGGYIAMPRHVRTFNNRVVEQDFDLIYAFEVYKIPEKTYKRREEYARDQKPVLQETLF